MTRLYAHGPRALSLEAGSLARTAPALARPLRGVGMLGRWMALLDDAQIEQQLSGSQWRRDGDAIVLDVQLADFVEAIALVDRIAEAAEAANHHPDILVHGWNKLRLTLSTHSEGGLTDADLALAASIDALR